MDEIIFRQKNAPQKVTGRRFLLGAAGIVLRLAVAQIAVNALIALSGAGLLNILFYLYAVALLAGFMRRTVAGTVYVLGARTLVLQSLLGDSTTAVVEIPLDGVIALRSVVRCEDLHLCYAQVTAPDAAARPGLRMRAAFIASMLSARLACLIAGKRAQEEMGWAVVFEEEGRLRACVLRPNDELLALLRDALPEAFDRDDRMEREPVRTIYARALKRAFPEQYPHVEPLILEEDMRWARGEIARQKAARKAKREEEEKRKKARAAAVKREKEKKKKRKRGKGDGEELTGIPRDDELPQGVQSPQDSPGEPRKSEPQHEDAQGASMQEAADVPISAVGDALIEELQAKAGEAEKAVADEPQDEGMKDESAQGESGQASAQPVRRRRRAGAENQKAGTDDEIHDGTL